MTPRHALVTAVAALVLSGAAMAQTNLVSTQLRPVEEAEKFRNVILDGAPDEVTFIPEDSNTYLTRMTAELQSAQGRVHVTGALDGEMAPLVALEGLQSVDDVLARLSADRDFIAATVELGRMGGDTQRFIPWMQNTYQMAASKAALEHLPDGADINALTYDELIEWATNIKAATGEAKFGLPAGPKGLLHRFFQGYAYPSYTGGVVRTFKSAEAERMWQDIKALWQVTNPRSTSYAFMDQPLTTGEVWVAFDHTARLLPALAADPDGFVTFPAPAGPHGRGFMPVVVGLAVPTNSPDRDAAERLIDHLTTPSTQATTLREVGFFPVVNVDVGTLPPAIRLAQHGVSATFSAPDGVASVLPVGLGARNGEFNKVFIDSFQRIVLREEDIKTVLAEQAQALASVVNDAGAPCWAPDADSGEAPCPVE